MAAHFIQFTEPAVRLQREFENVFDTLLGTVSGGPGASPRGNGNARERSAFSPSLNMWESQDSLMIELEMPGVEPQDVDVTIEANVLTIEGERKPTFREQEANQTATDAQKEADASKEESARLNCLHSERKFGKFRRQLELPETVQTDSIRAEQKNGVLTVTLQKQKRPTPRKVPVNVVS